MKLTREAALSGVPVQAPAVRREAKGEKLYVTVRFARPRWQRWLGANETAERTFGLDAYGRDVYERCDGATPVSALVRNFAGRHCLSVAESELAVTSFLKTLMSRGLIGVTLERN